MEIDEVGVAGECGETEVGGVTVTSGRDRENLPVLNTAFVKKVYKTTCFFAKGTDTEVTWKG